MTVGVGFLGRAMILTFGGASIPGIVTKGLSLDDTPVDTSDDQSSGNGEYLAEPGRKDRSITLSIKVKNLDLVQSKLETTSQIYAVTLTFPDGASTGSVVSGDAFFNNFALTGEHEGLTTADITLTFSGDVSFTAAT